MREIKFRVWDNQGDFYWGEREGMDFKKIAFNFYDSLFEECRLVFQQYTGLLDKNGKEIYEGDFIRFDNQEGVWPDQVGRNIEVKYPFICGNAHLGEVIGNIFENKDLLEKEQ
jgi:hypothetical protein